MPILISCWHAHVNHFLKCMANRIKDAMHSHEALFANIYGLVIYDGHVVVHCVITATHINTSPFALD